MKIVMFSINPLFPDKVTGGASKHLYHIALHLGGLGHQVDILCARGAEPLAPFDWDEHVRVHPILPFHLPFPQPYAISGAELALILERLDSFLADADRFYIHDGEFLLPDAYRHLPTIVSLRDNIYPESVMGSFVGKYDDLICVSPFSADVIRATVGRFYPELDGRLHQINNGIDFTTFRQVDPAALAEQLGLDLERQIVLLHPHRPEPGKGLPEIIRVAEALVHRQGIQNLRVLVPEWIGSMVSMGELNFYQEMVQLMVDLDVRENFVFVPWIPAAKMPELYSLGQVTLCLGNIVEAFGNVAYESLACGTPSVVARVGVHRTLLPDELLDKVDYGDIQAAADCIAEIVRSGRGVSEKTLAVLHEHLDYENQVSQYAQIITQAQKRAPMTYQSVRIGFETPFRLAPWCYFQHSEVYHDFRGRFESAPELASLFSGNKVVTRSYFIEEGFVSELWDAWVEKTYIVPIRKE